ncbi:hypothetical protein [Lachnoclostridium phytofermentans]|uniref:Uncharacterized protein n=1 Tax=Lachnoclostridium phytofermentans (strain ATCC 700394 / DSM 18823 / ISDg) TaxID=357809 RepID=A9KQ13_LACP7|nr:hypothetical protein [Lachnoclostridium phytofermentans]ABX43325.1 conserved hypothetical protein [Lachnoclostridium phytofermentans ISDg]
MDLLSALKNINELNQNTKLKILCVGGIVVEGTYDSYTSALDNEPEEAEITIRDASNKGLVEILESEIETIEVISN